MATASRGSLGVRRLRVLAGGLGQRPLGPGDGAVVIAGAKRQPAHLLEQVRPLDRIAVVAEQRQAVREAGAGALALARLPVQPANLPLHAGGGSAVAVIADLLAPPPRSARWPPASSPLSPSRSASRSRAARASASPPLHSASVRSARS